MISQSRHHSNGIDGLYKRARLPYSRVYNWTRRHSPSLYDRTRLCNDASTGDIEENNGKARIIVHELPYQVNKARLVEKIAELVREKKIEGITDLRDESDRNGMRVVIELRRDITPSVVLNNLYKQTQMQSNLGIICWLLLTANRVS